MSGSPYAYFRVTFAHRQEILPGRAYHGMSTMWIRPNEGRLIAAGGGLFRGAVRRAAIGAKLEGLLEVPDDIKFLWPYRPGCQLGEINALEGKPAK
jgi:hypothetical protein